MKKQQQNESLYLSEMREGEDGIVITGGGFMIAGPGDLNGDGINDILIVNYPNWQGKQNNYLLSFPEQVSVPPTFLPSSSPSSQPSSHPSSLPTLAATTETPTNHPSVVTFPPVPVLEPGESVQPTIVSIFTTRPTKTPKHSSIPSARPTRRPTSFRPTLVPSCGPTRVPTIKPTSQTVNSENPTSQSPSLTPSTDSPVSDRPFTPTLFRIPVFNESFQTVLCTERGIYRGNDHNQVFQLTANAAFYHITSRPENSSKASRKVFYLEPGRNLIVIDGFDVRYDVLDFSSYYPSLQNISDISLSSHPLQLFPSEG
jgi:hypothetical protein